MKKKNIDLKVRMELMSPKPQKGFESMASQLELMAHALRTMPEEQAKHLRVSFKVEDRRFAKKRNVVLWREKAAIERYRSHRQARKSRGEACALVNREFGLNWSTASMIQREFRDRNK